jgi:hypothetical protein
VIRLGKTGASSFVAAAGHSPNPLGFIRTVRSREAEKVTQGFGGFLWRVYGRRSIENVLSIYFEMINTTTVSSALQNQHVVPVEVK